MRPYGQHFLKCEDVALELVDRLNPRTDDVVVEIGCGKGFLTRFVAQRGCRLVCYEIDESLSEEFKRNVPFENVELRLKDFLEVGTKEIESARLCYGSIPYQISSKIVRKMIELGFERCLFIVQKEFAEKLVLGRERRKHTLITLLSQTYFNVSILRRVPKRCFEPPPKVDSVMIELVRKDVGVDLDSYEDFLKRLFLRPNRSAKAVLKEMGVDQCEAFEDARIWDLNVEQALSVYMRWSDDERRTLRNRSEFDR